MKKINRGYTSVFEYLVEVDFPFVRKLHEFFYYDEHESKFSDNSPYKGFRWNHTPYAGEKILGAFQPLIDIKNYLFSIIKAYKSTDHMDSYEISQVLGIAINPLKGVLTLVATPLLFIGNIIRYPFISGEKEDFKEYMKNNAIRSAGWLINGVSSIVRGAMQFLTMVLTPIRFIVRGVITVYKGPQKIEDTVGVNDLVNNASENDSNENLYHVAYELHRKFNKYITINPGEPAQAFKNIRHTSIPKKQEETLYQSSSRNDKSSLTNYIALFKPADSQVDLDKGEPDTENSSGEQYRRIK